MIKLKLVDLIFDDISQMGIMLLEEVVEPSQEKSARIIPIWIGIFEAQAILFKLRNMFFPRPLTHDLLRNCIETLGAKVDYIVISEVKDNTYYAQIHLSYKDNKYVIDSRPSDAVALAVRTDAEIYVSEDVINKVGMTKEEFMKEQKEKFYKQLLELTELTEDKKLKH